MGPCTDIAVRSEKVKNYPVPSVRFGGLLRCGDSVKMCDGLLRRCGSLLAGDMIAYKLEI